MITFIYISIDRIIIWISITSRMITYMNKVLTLKTDLLELYGKMIILIMIILILYISIDVIIIWISIISRMTTYMIKVLTLKTDILELYSNNDHFDHFDKMSTLSYLHHALCSSYIFRLTEVLVLTKLLCCAVRTFIALWITYSYVFYF